MIIVTIGEKPKEEKPFPKLMRFTYRTGGDVYLLINEHKKGIVLAVKDEGTGILQDKVGDIWTIKSSFSGAYTDIYFPITIQNA